jgi:hypothetical protein
MARIGLRKRWPCGFIKSLPETEGAHLEFQRRHLEFERETAERIAGMEAQMAEIIRVQNEQGCILERLPEAIRDRIGFKAQKNE